VDAWWKKAIIYELYVDKWAGNFGGLTERLDYFNWLGVNTLWILPHYPSPMVDGGYDIADYRGVRADLGTLEDFGKFVQAAHQRNLKVIVDMVLNHTSDQHPWFQQARSNRENPKRSWYLWGEDENRYWEANVAFPDIKPKNWVPNLQTNDFYYATFYPQQPDLNWDNPEVAAEMTDTMKWWLKMGVDGFRLDAIGRLVKRDNTNSFSLPETHDILKRLRAEIEREYPKAVLLAESGGWPHEAKQFFGAGDECQMAMNFQLATAMVQQTVTGKGDLINQVWQQSAGIPDDCAWGVFLTNHDSVDLWFLSQSEASEIAAKVDPGNEFSWQTGESLAARLGEVCGGDADKIVAATKLLLDQPGVPILYYGNELGMRNADLRHKPVDTREYVRGEFDWSEVERQKADQNSVLNRIRQLLGDDQTGRVRLGA